MFKNYAFLVRCSGKDIEPEIIAAYPYYLEAQKHLCAVKKEHDNLIEPYFTSSKNITNKYHKTNRAFSPHRKYDTFAIEILDGFNEDNFLKK